MSFRLPKDRAYIIAEAGVNHDGKVAKARQLIDVAADAKADAVKFQLFTTDEIISKNAPLAEYQKRSGEQSQYAMVKRLELPYEAFRDLKAYAESKGLDFIVTPFDATSAQFLASLGVKTIKIPSGEITNIPFLRQVADLHLFTIISTGMSTLEEVAEAVEPFQTAGTPYALLHCVSAYPAPIEQINLRAMKTLEETFHVPVGYSDHTEGIEVAITAVALGARIIEKHFTINRNDTGPDHAASLEPDALKTMISITRDKNALQKAKTVQEALGTGEKQCQPCERNTRDVVRRSLVLSRNARAGEKLSAEMIALKRPGTGLPPKMLQGILGKTLKRDLDAGELLAQDDVA
ncbi:N-acetylneuraminate synthase [Candidatus Peribacteria bacterium RIFCSPHIGHO2_02_FULL_53_20]|nr:MAG: N-acetylneuraminate synthase [Candidatus Peribacteria bacterium RIFCSPHIGHO2_02_FULL_53_20]OGJ67233.1 MAG: N-acetylneuraminate synthase [Candidatus Peribacteria bacterium RIFCSPLOWO2_01_FULL_53_10]OGJ70662.1 MAG: N-acetylneuraminate synthase [Candidatus Peribacteria bacterium RIFCSPLOWO2_12_FULL_53_10]